jgi:hypothetical protein
MVDNVEITAGSGVTVAADDIAGVIHQRVKISVGADGSASDMVGGAGAVSAAVPRMTLASDDPAVALLTTIDSDTSRLTSSAGPTAVGSALSTTSFMVGARYNSTPPTFTDGQEGGLQVTAAGRLITHDTAAVAELTTLSGAVSSSRVAVNLISGQAGVAAGSGANGATVPRVTIATDDQTAANLNNALKGEYETVAASQTAQVLGATGATGDYLAGVLIVPATTSPGNVLILDNATSITIFAGGASSVSNLVPFFVPLGMTSVSGAWKITTGANVSCIGIGNFT